MTKNNRETQMRQWKALDETAKLWNPRFLFTKPMKIAKITTFLEAISKKLTENVNEVIETKNYVNNSCGYTCCFSNGQMAVAHGQAAFCVWPISPMVNLPRGNFYGYVRTTTQQTNFDILKFILRGINQSITELQDDFICLITQQSLLWFNISKIKIATGDISEPPSRFSVEQMIMLILNCNGWFWPFEDKYGKLLI